MGTGHWEENLYRHPLWQGIRSGDENVMQHDLYSHRPMLLDIGLSMSFLVRPHGLEVLLDPNAQLKIPE